MVKEIAWKWIDDHRDEFIDVSDKIWGYAEFGLCEDKSSKLHAEKLKKYGFRVQLGVAGMPTAILAEWGSGRPIIGVQGEYDALPASVTRWYPVRSP